MGNPPIVIVEGPDGAGKTTLIKTLFPGWLRIHNGPLVDPFQTYIANLNYTEQNQVNTIFDRFFYSELAYGPVMRGGSKLTWAHCRMLERILLAHEVVVVFAMPPFEVCQANYFKNRGNEYVDTEDRFLAVYNNYHKLIDLHRNTLARVPVFIFDYTKEPLTELLKSRILHKQAPRNQGPGIGCFRPGVTLLVGDRCSHDRFGNLPFVDDGGCSLWLAELLEQWGIPEKQLYWVNAFIDGRITDFSFVEKLEPKRIIALGLAASMELRRQGIRHQTVHHPQHHKRFMAKRAYPLHELFMGENHVSTSNL